MGADGLLVVTDSVRAGVDAGMVVINADGSRPEMCGNGLRCVASHVASSHRDRHDPGTSTVTVCIETDAGDMDCRVRAGEKQLVDALHPLCRSCRCGGCMNRSHTEAILTRHLNVGSRLEEQAK